MPLALSLFFTVLIGITRVNYGRWSTLPGVLWATWCFSATLLFFLPDSLDLISADSFMAIVLPHIVMMFGLLPSWLLSAGYCRTNAADNKQSLATLVDGSNKSLIWSLFVIFWCAGFVGSVLQLRMTGAWAIADLSEIYEIRDLVVGKFFRGPILSKGLGCVRLPGFCFRRCLILPVCRIHFKGHADIPPVDGFADDEFCVWRKRSITNWQQLDHLANSGFLCSK